jgi:succinoglycan exporter
MEMSGVRAVRGSLSFSVQNGVNSLLGTAFFMLLARMITKTDMGVLATLGFTYTLFQTLGFLGLNVAAARYIPKLQAEGKNGASAAKSIIQLAVASAASMTLIYAILAPQFSLLLAGMGDYKLAFGIASFVVSAGIIGTVVDAVMQGIQEYQKLAIVRVLAQIARIVVSVALLLLGYGLVAVLTGWVVSWLSLSLMCLPIISKRLSPESEETYPHREIMQYSSPLMASQLLLLASNWIDICIVMIYVKAPELGAYNVAITASGLLGALILTPITSTLLPTISQIYGENGSIKQALTKATRYIALLYMPAAFGLTALAAPAIRLLAGAAYGESVVPLAIISVASITHALALPIITVLQTIGDTVKVFKITTIAVIADVATCLSLIPVTGVVGASIGRCSLFLFTLIYATYEARKVIAIKFDKEAAWKAILASTIMAAPLFILQKWNSSIIVLPGYIILGAATYLLAIKALKGINGEDFSLLEQALPRRLKWIMKPVTWKGN